MVAASGACQVTAAALQSTASTRQKQAQIDATRIAGQLQEADALALTDYWSDQIDAANIQFAGTTSTNVDWTGTDYGARTTPHASESSWYHARPLEPLTKPPAVYIHARGKLVRFVRAS